MAESPPWSEDPRQLERTIDELDSAAASRRALDRLLIRLYFGRPISVPAIDARRPSAALADMDSSKAGGFSIVREVVDAAAALVVRMPSLKVLPVGQRFKIQRGAKLMSRYLNGVLYENRVKMLAPALFLDGATTRTGALKWYVDRQTKRVRCERMNSLWLLWDDAEGPEPQSLYYQAPASKRFLAAAYPEKASEIWDLPRWSPPSVPAVEFATANQRELELVKVKEAWSLPQGKKKGRHIIQVGKDLNLVDEKWGHRRFPVVRYPWAPGYRTWGGRPLAEVLVPYQLWMNKLMLAIAECAKGSIPFILLHELAEVPGLSDRILQKVPWRGQIKPEIVTPTAISQDLWRLRELLKAEAYEEGGVNPAIAQGTTSDNLKSAPAQRERMDIASTRLIHPTERFEDTWRESGEVIVMLSSEAGGAIAARSQAGSYLREIPWEEIGLGMDDYAVEVRSTAALPLTVGGRLDFVNDLMLMKKEDGSPLISARDGLKMMQLPDTEAILDRETASQELADHQVESALWEGVYVPPEPIQDLAALIDTASKELMLALQNDTFPSENLELCRRLIAEAKLLQTPPAPPAPAPGVDAGAAVAPPGAPPPGPPGPGPGTDLVPAGAPSAAA